MCVGKRELRISEIVSTGGDKRKKDEEEEACKTAMNEGTESWDLLFIETETDT
jgi:hypothetical protein